MTYAFMPITISYNMLIALQSTKHAIHYIQRDVRRNTCLNKLIIPNTYVTTLPTLHNKL